MVEAVHNGDIRRRSEERHHRLQNFLCHKSDDTYTDRQGKLVCSRGKVQAAELKPIVLQQLLG